jgi:hypothetical protein
MVLSEALGKIAELNDPINLPKLLPCISIKTLPVTGAID